MGNTQTAVGKPSQFVRINNKFCDVVMKSIQILNVNNVMEANMLMIRMRHT